MSQPELRVTIILRNDSGHVADVQRWAHGIDEDIRSTLKGLNIEVLSVEIERKLEGYEKIT